MVARIFFFKIFQNIILEIAIPSIYPKAQKKLYIALVKGRLVLEAKAWVVKPYVLKSILRPILVTRERTIQEGILVNQLRQIRRPIPRAIRNYLIQSKGLQYLVLVIIRLTTIVAGITVKVKGKIVIIEVIGEQFFVTSKQRGIQQRSDQIIRP